MIGRKAEFAPYPEQEDPDQLSPSKSLYPKREITPFHNKRLSITR